MLGWSITKVYVKMIKVIETIINLYTVKIIHQA
jgi:hypothetical protein